MSTLPSLTAELLPRQADLSNQTSGSDIKTAGRFTKLVLSIPAGLMSCIRCWRRSAQTVAADDDDEDDENAKGDSRDSKTALVLEQEVRRLKKDLEEQKKLKSTSEAKIINTMDPDEVDKWFWGNPQENPKKVETKIGTFYQKGSYNSIMLDDKNGLNECELGQLMVSLSKECYDSAMEVSLKTVTKKLKELFYYQPYAENNPQDFENTHHAYGLLLTQCAKEHYESEVLTEVKQKLLSDEYKRINDLFLKNKPLFDDLCGYLICHSVEMVTISPPHTQQGLYTYDSIVSEDTNGLNQCVRDQLMVLSKECYDSAVEVSLKTVTKKLKELFNYQPDAEKNPQDFENTHHAYGLLLTQCAKEHYESDVLAKVEQKLSSDEYKKINDLFLKNEQLFDNLRGQLIHHSVEMVTISPPIILHTQETFDKAMTLPIANRNPTPPLLWTQPVLMRNLYGHVCVKGRAGNRKDMEQSDDVEL